MPVLSDHLLAPARRQTQTLRSFLFRCRGSASSATATGPATTTTLIGVLSRLPPDGARMDMSESQQSSDTCVWSDDEYIQSSKGSSAHGTTAGACQLSDPGGDGPQWQRTTLAARRFYKVRRPRAGAPVVSAQRTDRTIEHAATDPHVVTGRVSSTSAAELTALVRVVRQRRPQRAVRVPPPGTCAKCSSRVATMPMVHCGCSNELCVGCSEDITTLAADDATGSSDVALSGAHGRFLSERLCRQCSANRESS